MLAEPIVSPVGAGFDSSRVERVFNACFENSFRTRLVGGAEEPFYQPTTDPDGFHLLYYREDYFASALHEVAHWCIAGEDRRQQPDFGYWYVAADRTLEQQRAFESAESRPQGLEWILSKACGYRFQPSADNLLLGRQGLLDSDDFKARVLEQARAWQHAGLASRAQAFYKALCVEFGTGLDLADLVFDLDELS